jgi:short-subunit dehydrogenase
VSEQLAAVEARLAADPPIEMVVNNAGFGTFGNFHELPVDAEEREIRLNVLAVVRLSHAAAAAMVPRGHGSLVNVSSVAGVQPVPGDATYAATKAFVTSFTQSLHEELRPHGIHVTVLVPGFTRTEFQERAHYEPKFIPGFAWQEPNQVAEAALDAVAKNHAICVPGVVNKVTVALSDVTPTAVTRRIAARVGRTI